MIAPLSFQRDIAVSDMLATPQQQEGVARIRYNISTRGFCVITGVPGLGKSCMIRSIEASLDKSKYMLCYINEAELTPKVLYSRILSGASISPESYIDKMKKQFREAVSNLYSMQERQLVVVIDNAQELPNQTIKELRYLISFELDSKSLLSLILVGHPELWDTLKLRAYESLFQFVSVHFRVPSLDMEQTKEFIVHQLKLSNHPLCFPDDIIKKIYQFASGIPRVINSICRNCLLDMEANKLEIVDGNVLDRVLNELFNRC
jgi:type II secretory pathway predicted ATPase ExeA